MFIMKIIKKRILDYLNQNLHTPLMMLMIIYLKKYLVNTSVKLADTLINITSQEENQMFINDIAINRDKIFQQDKYGKFVIQPTHKHGNLLDVVRVILKFNEVFSLDLT